MNSALPKLDPREAQQFVAELLSRRLGYVPEWLPAPDSPDIALVQVAARYWASTSQRLNQASEKSKLAFFNTLGIEQIRAQAARTTLAFRLADDAPDARLPAGTRVAAPPPPERNDQIVFETENATGLTSAKLKKVVSLWPGRDQYIDHTELYLAKKSFEPFKRKLLENTPHHLYLAHDTLLALAGKSAVDVTFDLTTPSSQHLDIIWEYWDGKVWRQFKNMEPQCDEREARKLDSTDGLQASGRFHLQTDCAATKKTTVNGIEAFWIRGRLNETLPPSGGWLLPEVETIKVGTSIANPLSLNWQSKIDTAPQPVAMLAADVRVLLARVTDETGSPLRGVEAILRNDGEERKRTDLDGLALFPLTRGELSVSVGPATTSVRIAEVAPRQSQRVNFSLTVSGLRPDKAFSDAVEVDVTKPFQPLGKQPEPGSAFFFTSKEIFSKPGATLQVYVETAQSAHDRLVIFDANRRVISEYLPHTVSWEYWNGKQWAILLSHSNDLVEAVSPVDFTGTGIVETLIVPFDMEETEVNGEKGKWMRVRLVNGGFGFLVEMASGQHEERIKFPFSQPPAVAKFLIGYTWQHGPFQLERVFAYNDFQYEDCTEEAHLPGQTLQPFKPVSDRTPTLYLGFDKKLPVDRLGILFEMVEKPEETDGPALLWQYFDGVLWQDLSVSDETQNLRLPGIVSLIGPEDSEPLPRFDLPLHWLRARLKEDGPPGTPEVKGLFPNAVHAIQHQTVLNEAIGASTGQPNQTFSFVQIPVLEGEAIEVREVAGLRANVEWRSVALEISGSESVVRDLDAMLARDAQTEIRKDDLRLIRDRNRRVTEVWVRWRSKRHLRFSGPEDRDYVVDRTEGLLLFGDGRNGKVPPAGAAIEAQQYRTGGGSAGNVSAGKISQILAPIGGIEEVFNPLPAEGGADSEAIDQFRIRASRTLRHRGRALLPADYETFAREASPAVAYARALPGRGPNGTAAGWVTLLVIPESPEPKPMPSFGLREEVREHIEANTSADLAAAHRIYVTGPNYLPVDLDVIVVPLNPAEAGAVEQKTREALQQFLHPLRGGPEGHGWDLGRDLFISDVASVVERTNGVDYVKDLRLLVDSELQLERVNVTPDRVVVAGQIRINVVET